MTPSKTEQNIEVVEVDLGGRTVSVPKGGLYDRYRMDTDLDEVGKDPRVRSVDFFRTLPKTEVQSAIGPTRTPNFYYAMSRAQIVYLAPTKALRSRLPGELDPLQIAPGIGLFSVVFFRYDVCDIDFYTEATVGIAVRPARHGSLGSVDALSALSNDSMHAYVLSLPVNTHIAQVRGHDGYGFPKWLTDIDVEINNREVDARVANDDGGTDIALTVATPNTEEGSQRHERVHADLVYTAWWCVERDAEPDQHALCRQSDIAAGCEPRAGFGPPGR